MMEAFGPSTPRAAASRAGHTIQSLGGTGTVSSGLFGRLHSTKCQLYRRGPGPTGQLLSMRASSPVLDAGRNAVSIPVDYSQLLGLRTRESYLDPQLIHAFEEISGRSPLEDGFTKQAEQGRAVILEEAVGELRRRRSRNSPVDQASQGFLVEWGLLPGTLALLQEVGEAEVTLEVGKAVLGNSKANPFKRDILLAMALAHCSLASSAFAAQDQVVSGCGHLSDSQACLKQAGLPRLAPELSKEIDDALHDLQAPALLEQLKAGSFLHAKGLAATELGPQKDQAPPSTGAAHTRRSALATLKHLLANPQAAAKRDGTQMVNGAFASEALARLTAPELVNLLDWGRAARDPESIPWGFPGMIKSAAIAHIVTGVVQRRPALVGQGEALLQACPQGTDTAVEHVVVKVLLGAPEAATRLLLEAEQAAAAPGRSGRSSRPSQWAAASDQQQAPSPPPIPQNGRSSPGGLPDGHSVAEWVRTRSPGAGEEEQGLLPGLCLLTERWLSEVALKQFWVQAERPPPSSLQAYFQDAKVTSYLATSGEEGETWQGRLGVLADQLSTGIQRLRDPPLTPPSSQPPGEAADARQGTSFGSQLVRALPGPLRQRATFLAALGLTAVAIAAMAARGVLPFQRGRLPGPLQGLLHAARGPGTAHSWQQATTLEHSLTSPVAEAVIRKWQSAKKYALGPRHDISSLSGAVGEPWLSVVIKDAAAAEQSGWFWTYKLDSLEVLQVAPKAKKKGPATAVVTARLNERGDLWAAMGKRVEDASYANPYTVEYHMTYGPHGWRITDALVLGDA